MNKFRKKSAIKRKMNGIISHEQFKPIFITVAASVSIGLIFGLIILQMVTVEQVQEAENVQANQVTTKGGTEEQVELPELMVYVHQGGVFSEKENATQYAKQLEQKNIPYILKEEADQYYVWMNPTNSEETAKQQVEKMDKQGMEVFVKAWELPHTVVEIERDGATWLQSFYDELLTSLESSTIDTEQWKGLLASHSLTGDYNEWQMELKELFQKEDQTNEQLLLSILAHYEKLLKDAK